MKLKFTFGALLFTIIGFAQIPNGYYNSATGTGYTLKSQLKTIITNSHNPKSYAQLWTFYANNALKDNYYEQDNTLLDIYSENPAGTDPYTFVVPGEQCGNYNAEGDCYNREHLIPKSYFNDASPMHDDAHHVVPADGKVNGWRDNYPFGVVGDATNMCNGGATNNPCRTSNNSRVGNNINTGYAAGFSGKVFEPIDEFKGDIARIYFYFATRYENSMGTYYNAANVSETQVKAMFDGTTNKVFNATFLNILLTWHEMDPVSPREIAVNNAVGTYQGNRNPFIDNPAYVQAIWGTALSTGQFEFTNTITVYPNPVNDSKINIYSEAQLDVIQLININGQTVQQISRPVANDNVYSLENLPQGFYMLRMESANTTVTKKIIVN